MAHATFELSSAPLEPATLSRVLADTTAGALVTFEGWVRDHHEGRAVLSLDYEAYAELAGREGTRVVAEAAERFEIESVSAVHRVGALGLGDLAVWVGVTAAHRDAAFAACRYVIDEVKARVPIWKKEHFADGTSIWVNCATRPPSGSPAPTS